MNTPTRRESATKAFIEKAHDAYHRTNGADAPCHRCGNVAKGEKGFNL
jgi:hypothetical protein